MEREARSRRARRTPAAGYLGASAVLSVATAALIVGRHPRVAGITAAASAAALLVATRLARPRARRRMPAGLPPLIGELAEGPADRERSVSPKARFAERVVDRAFDASVLAPLAWTLQGIHPHTAVLALVGLGTSFLASYERARGQGLGYRGTESPAYWAARTVILVVGLLAGYELGALIAFVALTGVAAAVRAWNVVVQQRRLRRRRVPA